MREKLLERRKGFATLLILFIFVSLVLVVIFGFMTPVMIDFDTQIYLAGQDVMTNIDVDAIQDESVKQQINQTLNESIASIPDQITILGFFHRYGWVVIIIIVFMILFVVARQWVEAERRGGFT